MIKILSLVLIIFNSQFSFIDFKEHLNYINIIPKNYTFVDDKIMLKSIFKQKINILKILGNENSKEKPVLFEVNGRKFVFKFIADNQKDASYFVDLNDFMSQNLLPIHKLFLIENFKNGTYGVFEYFENFITTPFHNYYKIGRVLATIDNITRKYRYSYTPQYQTKIEMFNEALKLDTTNKYREILDAVTFNLEENQKYFENLHNHFDLNCENLDPRFRIINLKTAHYDWRINNFLNILFVKGLTTGLRGEDSLIQAIHGYNSISENPLNGFEIIGIFDIVIGHCVWSKILNKQNNIVYTNLPALYYLKSAI